jgi:MFS family permease
VKLTARRIPQHEEIRELDVHARPGTGDEWWRLLPRGTSGDAGRILLTARGLRAFADGFVSLLLPIYLVELGFSALAIGAIVTSTLIGTALLTLWVGLIANRYSRRRLLLAAALLMAATGAGFAVMTDFWPLLVIAFVGTMNPTSGDASIFGPLEQTVLTQTVEPRRRTALFARYSVIGSLAGALGVLAASSPDLAAVWTGWTRAMSMQFMFALYAALGIVALVLYRPLSPAIEMASEVPAAPLRQSRRLVYGLAALFGMDSFGTGFLVQSLLALWLYQSFQISVTTAAAILFWSGVCSAISYLVAVPIAKRIGLINTMVFTHLPSNLFLILIPSRPISPRPSACCSRAARCRRWTCRRGPPTSWLSWHRKSGRPPRVLRRFRKPSPGRRARSSRVIY